MRRLSAVLLLTLAIAACKKKEAPQPQAAGGQAAPSTTVKGKIVERLDADPYSYLRIKTEQGETWAAVPKTDKVAGAEVEVTNAMAMPDFESKTLKRKFEMVYFGTLGGAEAPAGGAAPMGGAMGGPMGGGMGGPQGMAAQHAAAAAGPADVGNVKVPKASGADARTIAEVFAQRTALKEKSAARS
jgi:hypothetical protein